MPRPPPGPTPSEPATPAALRSSFARLTGEPTCEAPTAGAGDGIIKAQEERLAVSLLRWLGRLGRFATAPSAATAPAAPPPPIHTVTEPLPAAAPPAPRPSTAAATGTPPRWCSATTASGAPFSLRHTASLQPSSQKHVRWPQRHGANSGEPSTCRQRQSGRAEGLPAGCCGVTRAGRSC